MSKIRLVEYGDEVGVNVGNQFTWHKKEDVTVSSNKDALISLFDKGELIISANTEDFIVPEEASVKDLVFLIKNIINIPDTVIPIEDLITLEDIYEEQLKSNVFLELIQMNTRELRKIKELLKKNNKLLSKIYR